MNQLRKGETSKTVALHLKMPALATCSCSSDGTAGTWQSLFPIDPDDATEEAIGDWHYWVSQGYIF